MAELVYVLVVFAAFVLGYELAASDTRRELAAKDRMIRGLADRVQAQSDLLSKRAEK
jgi:hypothetical protein